MANDALAINQPDANITINENGSDWLWAAFAVFLLVDLIIIGWTWSLRKGRRVFHHLAIFMLTIGAIAYFAWASGLGQTPIQTEFRGTRTRSIWYTKYIFYTLAWPMLILEVLLLSGLALSDVVATMFFAIVMAVTFLVGALVRSSYKWGFFAFALASLVYVWFVLLGPARRSAGVLGFDFKKSYTASAGWISFMFLLYPIAWGLCEGGNRISPDSETAFFGVIDVLLFPFFLIFHLWQVSRLDYTKMELQSGKFSEAATIGGGAPRGDAEMNNLHTKNRLADAGGAHTTSAQPRMSEATAVQPQTV
jgi:bacteriorhodopsin